MTVAGRRLAAGRPVDPGGAAPTTPPLYAYVLDADDDLAQELDVRMRFAARQLATARVLDAGPAQCDLAPWFDAAGQGPGLLILDGLIAVDTRHRRPHRDRAAGRRRPAAAAEPAASTT